MKSVTSATVFQDAVGLRLSVTYSVINEDTGIIVEDNKRANRVIVDPNAKEIANGLLSYAQEYIDTLD